jgi:hypothetical protein
MVPPLVIATALLSTAPQQSTTDPPVRLEITLRGYRVDGSLDSTAEGTMADKVPSRTWVDLTTCATGVGIDPRSGSLPPSAIVWQYTGRIVEHMGSVYVVEISVHRMDATASEASPRTMTLNLGVPVVLDDVSGQSACGMRSARLEVSVASALEMRVGAGGGGRSASGVGMGRAGAGGGGGNIGSGAATGGATGGVSNLGGRGGAGTLGGGGIGVAATSGRNGVGVTNAAALVRTAAAGDSAVIDFSGTGASTPSAGSVRTLLRSMPAASYDVEVWLVHTPPDGPPETRHISGHLDPLGQVIEFSPEAVQTTHGIGTVNVAAMFRPMITADGLIVLRATIARVLSGGEGFGVTDKVIPMPGPTDVVSFEMPSHGPSSDPIVQFSLRVRITPGRMPEDR